MKIKFLTKKQALKKFEEPDIYARTLTETNLKKICPLNPTLNGYQEVFLNSFISVPKEEKHNLNRVADKLSMIDLEIEAVKTSRAHCYDIIHTRSNCLVSSSLYLSERLLAHETYHIISRLYPDLTEELSAVFGFYRTRDISIPETDWLINPDAIRHNHRIKVQHKKYGRIGVTPYMNLRMGTNLLMESGEHCGLADTNYNELISLTSYHSHPEEVCAEYFSHLIIDGLVRLTEQEMIIMAKFKKILEKRCVFLKLT